MKKLAIILVAVLSFGIFTAQAAEKAESKSEVNAELKLDTSTEYETIKVAAKVPFGLKHAILSDLSDAAQHRHLKGEVYMRFCLDHNNGVKILGINATRPNLKKFVERELSSTKVENPCCLPGQVYMMKVNFTKE